MGENKGRATAGTLEGSKRPSSSDRLDEERARQILERAAALDAERSSEIEIGQLREAAAAAGISAESFEQAMREQSESDSPSGPPAVGRPARTPGTAEVSHYAGVLKDLLGDDAQVTVVEDRIEGRDRTGLAVSISPSSGDVAAAIVAEGSLSRRLAAIVLSSLIPAFLGLVISTEEPDAGVLLVIGVVLAVVASGIGTFFSHKRERKDLEQKAERVRRQLQRMLKPGE